MASEFFSSPECWWGGYFLFPSQVLQRDALMRTMRLKGAPGRPGVLTPALMANHFPSLGSVSGDTQGPSESCGEDAWGLCTQPCLPAYHALCLGAVASIDLSWAQEALAWLVSQAVPMLFHQPPNGRTLSFMILDCFHTALLILLQDLP